MASLALDSYDVRILDALQKDASLTNVDLAEIVHLSASQCSRRRAALEASGVIEAYHAKLNAEILGLKLRAIVRLNMKNHDQVDDVALSKWLTTQPEIQTAFSVSGDADYILTVRVDDLDTFSGFIHDKLLRQPQIAQVRSEFVLKTLKDTSTISIEATSQVNVG
ncbi:AsnC family transcriptional regulator [Tateyamaria omphalii]|uniref:Lrp/AsnC family transcriptional regulator n=1 Tax=Tateyamaria omphalii TaxID=299262 RepID=UPI0016770C64|nr:Lrp/AsnC family transcriptional regulator [Tateyamaria omphalii]GGX41490.1 AsnC family transcriptional regulator [Tateyamaria omphalii]